MTIEQRIREIADGVPYPYKGNLREIAVEARKMEDRIKQLEDRIKRLEEAGDGLMKSINCGCPYGPSVFNCQACTNSWDAWREAKEANP